VQQTRTNGCQVSLFESDNPRGFFLTYHPAAIHKSPSTSLFQLLECRIPIPDSHKFVNLVQIRKSLATSGYRPMEFPQFHKQNVDIARVTRPMATVVAQFFQSEILGVTRPRGMIAVGSKTLFRSPEVQITATVRFFHPPGHRH